MDRHQQGPGHFPEPLPGVGPVNGRRLVHVGADGLQPRQERDGEEGRAPPDVHQDDGAHGHHWSAQPIHSEPDEPHLVEDPVHDGEGGIQHPFPRQGREDGGDDPGKEHGGPEDALEPDEIVQHEGDQHAEGELQEGRAAGVDEGILGGPPEDAIVPELRVVLQPYELALAPHHRIQEAQPDPAHEGVGHEQPKHDEGRGQKDQGQEPLPSLGAAGAAEASQAECRRPDGGWLGQDRGGCGLCGLRHARALRGFGIPRPDGLPGRGRYWVRRRRSS